MNVAAHALILSTQRLPAELRREPKIKPRPDVAIKRLRDAQSVAPGQGVASEPKRRDAFAERRKPRRPSVESTRSLPVRDGDERGRLLDVYC
ncbi:MAG: hypothetical protein IJE77_08960 [Thermoguttaceae bacterium]|nr:hypothetical protein [Thermoguttaceae bacterium]MBQ9800013.1 hypothetical protein [Thermoguttaceae bacterium]